MRSSSFPLWSLWSAYSRQARTIHTLLSTILIKTKGIEVRVTCFDGTASPGPSCPVQHTIPGSGLFKEEVPSRLGSVWTNGYCQGSCAYIDPADANRLAERHFGSLGRCRAALRRLLLHLISRSASAIHSSGCFGGRTSFWSTSDLYCASLAPATFSRVDQRSAPFQPACRLASDFRCFAPSSSTSMDGLVLRKRPS